MMELMLSVDWASKEPMIELPQWQGRLTSCLLSAVKAGKLRVSNMLCHHGVGTGSRGNPCLALNR
jgi:hypothetical protein